MEPTNQPSQLGKRKQSDEDACEYDEQLRKDKKLHDMNEEEKRAYNRKMSARARKRQKDTIAGLTNQVDDYQQRNGKLEQLSNAFATVSSALADENRRLRLYVMEHVHSAETHVSSPLPQVNMDVHSILASLLAQIAALRVRRGSIEQPTVQPAVTQDAQVHPTVLESPVDMPLSAPPQSPLLTAILSHLSGNNRSNAGPHEQATHAPRVNEPLAKAQSVTAPMFAWSPHPMQPSPHEFHPLQHAPTRATSIPAMLLAQVIANRRASSAEEDST